MVATNSRRNACITRSGVADVQKREVCLVDEQFRQLLTILVVWYFFLLALRQRDHPVLPRGRGRAGFRATARRLLCISAIMARLTAVFPASIMGSGSGSVACSSTRSCSAALSQ
ncbi:hypothetical protein MRX96_012027 [Rhipicephalus microplus]